MHSNTNFIGLKSLREKRSISFSFFLAMEGGMWDPSFLNRDPTCFPSTGSIDLTTGLLGESEIYFYLFVCLTVPGGSKTTAV